MTNIEIIYAVSVLVALGGAVPQMNRLVKIKSSGEFSIVTWSLWVVAQSVSFIYAVSVGAHAYMAACAAWMLFYGAMLFLIIKYRPKEAKKDTAAPEAAFAEVTELAD